MHQVTAAPSGLGDLEELQLGCLGTIRTILGVFSPGHEEKIPTLQPLQVPFEIQALKKTRGLAIGSSSRGSPLLREVTSKERRSGIFSIEWHKLLPSSFASSTMPSFLSFVRFLSSCIILFCLLAFTNDSFCRFFIAPIFLGTANP